MEFLDLLSGLSPLDVLMLFWPQPLRISPMTLIILSIIYLPLTIWSIKALKKMKRPIAGKVLKILLINLVLWAIPLGDAYYASVQYNYYCTHQYGMRIYKTVNNVKGFYTDQYALGEGSLGRGYKYSEILKHGKLYRLERVGDGVKVKFEPIDAVLSRYYFGRNERSISRYVKEKVEYIQDRDTQKLLGENYYYLFYPALLDRLLFGWVEFIPPGCKNKEISSFAFYTKILKPVSAQIK